ncbi:hypothetical protein K461DRAFT_219019 [Myriangium duriaei CBS 260.36]|uniref:mRNA N(6)-methyladenine demethylase n=1 Tax=Myriangium duriaei CBS 260.36 TaxID=1168546 RepID=A0A9P4J8A4_9PEZI|nr:hypothetical protein K461DRAFT_219019 [Myriangium duriaei CBS 260.36]
MSGLDAHVKPPTDLRNEFKRHQKATTASLDLAQDIFDPVRGSYGGFVEAPSANRALSMPIDLVEVVHHFMETKSSTEPQSPIAGYEHPDLPGLYVFPSLLPSAVQISLLDRLFHRDASNTHHRTNLHLHYDLEYPSDHALSFFDNTSSDIIHNPKDPHVHKSLPVSSMLRKKLRWITLGGQYDWSAKVYPTTEPPPFPPDIAALIDGIFPSMKAEAAILNLYSAGDTLSLHRDVSEFCNRPLASFSLGCDGLFLVGLSPSPNEPSKFATLRLRSGDIVVMSDESRFAWHGVPKILEGTCPDYLADWPCVAGSEDEQRFANWKGWMAGKRINLNVRQMYDGSTSQSTGT